LIDNVSIFPGKEVLPHVERYLDVILLSHKSEVRSQVYTETK